MDNVVARGVVPNEQASKPFEEWCVVELMGHRRIGAKVTEAQIAGASFLRLEIPKNETEWTTQFYRPEAVYCMTPTTEAIARGLASQFNPPVSRFDLPQLPAPAEDKDEEDVDDDIDDMSASDLEQVRSNEDDPR